MEAKRKKDREERDAKRKATREERDQKREDRRQTLQEQGKAFEDTSVPAWRDQVQYGEERGALESICRKLIHFERRADAFDVMKRDKIRWHQTNAPVREDEAYSKFRRDGIVLAKELVAALEMDRPARRCDGLDLTDGVEILEKAVHVLERVKATPADIQKTWPELRVLALQELQANVVRARNAGNGSSQGMREAYRKAREWNFTSRDVGMTAEEERQASLR